MPKKVGKKFRVVHKFGKRKRKRRSDQSSCEPKQTEAESSTFEPTPSTSSAQATIEERTTASAKKLHFFAKREKVTDSSDDDSEPGPSKKSKVEEEEMEEDVESPSSDLNMIVNLGCLQSLITSSGALCPHCNEPTLRVSEGGSGLRMGSACLLEIQCVQCGKLSADRTSQKSGMVHTGYDINRRIVAASTGCGVSFQQTKRFFALLGMPPPMNEKTWYGLKQRVHGGAKRAVDKHLQEAGEEVRSAYLDMNLGVPDDEGILDISISIDGTWHKRGRTSHSGVVTVIDLMTGVVLDCVALSNFCQVCEGGPKPGDEGYDTWIEKHRSQCQKNIDCSSSAMEMEGAVILFKRSVQLHGFRYSQMLGDGDAKTHSKLLEVDPYNGRPVEKLDCVNHVTKRMGTALRNVVEKQKAIGEPIGGRNKLTEVRIKELTSFYGKAIKDHPDDLDEMQNAVWASFFHTISTDDSHNHDLCPKGPFSWCFFQRALANNTPPPQHRRPLPAKVAQALKPIYQRLGDPQLLRRCLGGKTQNSNESFHSVLWNLCPKERWANQKTVETALFIAVQRFNKGASAHMDVLLELELVAGSTLEEFTLKEDTARVVKATKKSSEKAKAKRKKIESIRLKERQERREREGDVYGAGQF